MKLLFAFASALALTICGRAQENKTIVVNPAKQTEGELLKGMYQYPQFLNGRAFNKNGNISEARFNYNYVSNQIIFIDPKGDTLSLVNGGDFEKITIQSDTFCYHDKEFIQQVTHYPSHNLFIKQSLRNTGSEKKGAYGTYSSTSSITSLNTVDVGNETVRIASDENIIYRFRHMFYISGKFNQFYPATRKGLYDLFPKNQKDIKDFLEKNDLDLSKRADVEKLLEYTRIFLK